MVFIMMVACVVVGILAENVQGLLGNEQPVPFRIQDMRENATAEDNRNIIKVLVRKVTLIQSSVTQMQSSVDKCETENAILRGAFTQSEESNTHKGELEQLKTKSNSHKGEIDQLKTESNSYKDRLQTLEKQVSFTGVVGGRVYHYRTNHVVQWVFVQGSGHTQHSKYFKVPVSGSYYINLSFVPRGSDNFKLKVVQKTRSNQEIVLFAVQSDASNVSASNGAIYYLQKDENLYVKAVNSGSVYSWTGDGRGSENRLAVFAGFLVH